MTDLVTTTPPNNSSNFMPVMNMADVIARRSAIIEFTQKALVEGKDYGKIPGAGDKPTLLKPGAEKLNTLFGLTPRFVIIEKIEDWTGKSYSNEPFFYYFYRCQLWRGAYLIAESDASCSSFEKKYRYRESQRKCPNCGAPAIIKGKAEYGGGYVCFAKKGGCNAKYSDNDPAIINQQIGQVANPDVCDQVNTIQKMAQKRALIGTTLLALNASEFFTQDIEDWEIDPASVIDGAVTTTHAPPKVLQPPKPAAQQAKITDRISAAVKRYEGRAASDSLKFAIVNALNDDYGDRRHVVQMALVGTDSSKEFTAPQILALNEILRPYKNGGGKMHVQADAKREIDALLTTSKMAPADDVIEGSESIH